MTGTATLLQNQKCYQQSKPEIEFDVMKEIFTALGMHTCSEKQLFRQGQLNHNEWGMVIIGFGATLPNHIPAFRSEFFLLKTPLLRETNASIFELFNE